MSKKTTEQVVSDSVSDDQNSKTNCYIDELKEKGSIVLSAKSREELADKISKIPSDIKFIAGPIGQDYDKEEFIINILKR